METRVPVQVDNRTGRRIYRQVLPEHHRKGMKATGITRIYYPVFLFRNKKKSYCFEMYQPVCVSSRILSVVFFVRKLTTIMAMSEMMKAYAEK